MSERLRGLRRPCARCEGRAGHLPSVCASAGASQREAAAGVVSLEGLRCPSPGRANPPGQSPRCPRCPKGTQSRWVNLAQTRKLPRVLRGCGGARQSCPRGWYRWCPLPRRFSLPPRLQPLLFIPSSAVPFSGAFSTRSIQGLLRGPRASFLCPPVFSVSHPGPVCLSPWNVGSRCLLSGSWHACRKC